MRVDRQSRIHRILGLVRVSWVVAPVLSLAAVVVRWQAKMFLLDPGCRPL